ncbi:unnamed protein product [Trypanosoma congolense IL3000]|uniref:WGS project CAEQ00000000 data, annotated contig 242 n=1 Tax=Trypanosoma congolense (strain IL3000) TaxID=1068625 RepID=F9WDZ2_TRYCI|nr:unnamed protein product [Trypanosoma congolense IL3000]
MIATLGNGSERCNGKGLQHSCRILRVAEWESRGKSPMSSARARRLFANWKACLRAAGGGEAGRHGEGSRGFRDQTGDTHNRARECQACHGKGRKFMFQLRRNCCVRLNGVCVQAKNSLIHFICGVPVVEIAVAKDTPSALRNVSCGGGGGLGHPRSSKGCGPNARGLFACRVCKWLLKACASRERHRIGRHGGATLPEDPPCMAALDAAEDAAAERRGGEERVAGT